MQPNEQTTEIQDQMLAAVTAGDESSDEVETSASEQDSDETTEASEASETEEHESEDEESDDSAEKPGAKKKKGGYQRRIDKLVASKSAAEQERDYWREQALRGSKNPETEKPVSQTQGKPKEEDFESHEAYMDAYTDWKVEQKLALKEAKAREDAVKSEAQTIQEKHLERVRAFAEKNADFDERLADVERIPTSLAFKDLITRSENGPEIFYELAADPAEFKRVASMHPLDAARAIGRIEARLATSETPKPKTTAAPPPVKPVSAKATTTKDPSKMSYQEHKAWMESQRKRK